MGVCVCVALLLLNRYWGIITVPGSFLKGRGPGCDMTFIYVHERDTYANLSTPSRQCQFDTGEPEYTRYTVDKMHKMH